jgi:hypothetical protein
MSGEVKLTHKIIIEGDMVTGDIEVSCDELTYSEILGLLEYAKMTVIRNKD